jgi:hypothetical protein
MNILLNLINLILTSTNLTELTSCGTQNIIYLSDQSILLFKSYLNSTFIVQ